MRSATRLGSAVPPIEGLQSLCRYTLLGRTQQWSLFLEPSLQMVFNQGHDGNFDIGLPAAARGPEGVTLFEGF